MTAEPFLAQRERFARVGSTNDVVRAWLEAGTPEVCLAVADEQTAGRGREGRAWAAPAGAGLLLSVGFRPDWLAPEHVWRLAAIVALAMADASETWSSRRGPADRWRSLLPGGPGRCLIRNRPVPWHNDRRLAHPATPGTGS